MNKTGSDLEGMRILIVDDTPENIDVLRRILSEYGFNISIAPNGEVALKNAVLINPDLILLDVMMPGIDGFETCRRLKANEAIQNIPVIFITAKTDTRDIVNGFSMGACDYIEKPFRQEEVIARVETQLRLSKTTTDLRSALVTLNKAMEDSQEKSEFMDRMSHELRTPMNAILGFAQLLSLDSSNPLTESQKQQIGKIIESGKHLLNMIDKILGFSSLDTGKQTLITESLSLIPLIEESVLLVEPVARKRGVTVVNNSRNSSELLVKGEAGRIKQIIQGLLLNAIHYNKEKGHVTINLKFEEGKVALSIIDAGDGIPESEVEKIFIPFYRMAHHKSLVGGIGMGLTIAKKLASLMEGQIRVESTPGEGSCFTLKLPLVIPLV